MFNILSSWGFSVAVKWLAVAFLGFTLPALADQSADQDRLLFGDPRAVRSITPKFSAFLYDGLSPATNRGHPAVSGWRQLLNERFLIAGESADLPDAIGYRFTDNLLGGVAFGTVTDTGLQETDRYDLSLFGSYGDERLQLDGQLGFGPGLFQEQTANRLADGTADNAATESDIAHFFVGLGLGYRIASGPFTITPRLQFDYTSVDIQEPRYALGGRTGFASADSQNPSSLSSLRSSLGGQISYPIEQDWGHVEPHVQLRWVHEFEDEADAHLGRRLRQEAAAPFALSPSVPEQDYFNLGLGVSARFGAGSAAFLSYEKVFGKKDDDAASDYTVTGGLRFEF